MWNKLISLAFILTLLFPLTVLAQPVITVVSPNGGEQWTIGTRVGIVWSTPVLAGRATIQLNRNYPNGEMGNTRNYLYIEWAIRVDSCGHCQPLMPDPGHVFRQ